MKSSRSNISVVVTLTRRGFFVSHFLRSARSAARSSSDNLTASPSLSHHRLQLRQPTSCSLRLSSTMSGYGRSPKLQNGAWLRKRRTICQSGSADGKRHTTHQQPECMFVRLPEASLLRSGKKAPAPPWSRQAPATHALLRSLPRSSVQTQVAAARSNNQTAPERVPLP